MAYRPVALATLLLPVLCSGCIIPLPGEVPIGGTKDDPKSLATEIRPGSSRNAVHDLLRQPVGAPDTKTEIYSFHTEGKFFFFGPNPEGGFIGVNHRHIEYWLQVDYDDSKVRSCKLTKVTDIYDSHESYWSCPP